MAAEGLIEAANHLPVELLAKLSAPFIVAPPDWWTARTRLLIVGQETCGWGGGQSDESPEETLAYWARYAPHGEAVGTLAACYQEFDFGSRYTHTAFWQAHRQLALALEDGAFHAVGWSNLMRADTGPYARAQTPRLRSRSAYWNVSWCELDAICAWQRNLTLAELSALQPRAIIFFTGPDYDHCLKRVFAEIVIREIENDGKWLAEVSSPEIGVRAFRTYHPAFLKRRKRWDVVSRLAELVIA